ncbi:MAG: hypothetical protein ACXVJT_18665 [Thermoanaerobaculia bacterium]
MKKSTSLDGVKVFSATMQQERDCLGEKVTAWLAANASVEIVDVIVTQSSDHAFHCLAITLFYVTPTRARRAAFAPARPG